MTNAELARVLARLARDINGELVTLAEGMGNPEFCKADAKTYALILLPDLRAHLDYIEDRISRDTS